MLMAELTEPIASCKPRDSRRWTYEEAFKRNRGLISEEQQAKLRKSRVAIAGMGGVGGVHLATLTRMGVGKFTIADPDVFEVANFNRQYGATVSNLGRNKAEAMGEAARDINPELDLDVMPAAIDEANVDEFLRGVDLLVDGLDFFAIEARRMVFRRAAELGIWAVTAGPMGFSAAVLAFDPKGMSFDQYFDLSDGMGRVDQLIAFAVGLSPKATHVRYMDLSNASISERTGPSAGLACQLCSSVVATESLKVLVDPSKVRAVPSFCQVDAYRLVVKHGRLRRGNRSVLQLIKRRVLKKKFPPASEGDAERVGTDSPLNGGRWSIPPVHRYVPLIVRQCLSKQTLERTPEPAAVTDQADHVLAYDQVMTTKLAIAYAVGIEVIYRCRPDAFGGRAIDLACGPGHMSLLMAKHLKLDSLEGVDLSPRMVKAATKNSQQQGLPRATFRIGDVTQLGDVGDATVDLTTFCDAAHHMPDLETVAAVLREMDRITRPDGLVVLMDLARLKTAKLTERYVELVGSDYLPRGLAAFYDDFRNSMYAAWTMRELAGATPRNTGRRWFQWSPAGLPTIQFLLGIPECQAKPCKRHGVPWQRIEDVLAASLQSNWKAMRSSLMVSSHTKC